MPSDPERDALLAGLRAPRAWIAPKFFYDSLGSTLFDAITELDEYYPTRTERAILRAREREIAAAFGCEGCTLIDLGAGNGEKAAGLFGALRPRQYVAVDISVDYLRQSLEALQRRFPNVVMTGVGADLTRPLELPARIARERRLYFYPGSSIGNFTPDEAQRFLTGLRAQLDDTGALLIGIDLVKDAATLQAAYDDPLGVTAAFNLNVLRRANRIAGTDFVLADWRHVAFFDATHSRIEMHLEARRALRVSWPGGERRFAAGERIHTENSYKYRLDEFAALLGRAGLGLQASWTDERDWFAVLMARPATWNGASSAAAPDDAD
ncbi:MAG: L-histidine N(alpha)-methyltransferase [Burkholderiaceae bacterium]|nr:L-histidine N(alpha)-methyltransferase [Burkholderiaceae bacterium]